MHVRSRHRPKKERDRDAGRLNPSFLVLYHTMKGLAVCIATCVSQRTCREEMPRRPLRAVLEVLDQFQVVVYVRR